MTDMLVYQIVIVIIFALALYNLMLSKNVVKSVLIIEMMLGAVNLFLFQSSIHNGNDPLGKAALITSIMIGAALSAYLLAMCVKVYRKFGTLDPDKLRTMRW